MSTLHPATSQILRYFEYDHLPKPQADISRSLHNLAHAMTAELDGPELTAGLRKLLEARDCFVRASLDRPTPTTAASEHTNATGGATPATASNRTDFTGLNPAGNDRFA